MSISYQEAFDKNLSAWSRRAGLQLDQERNTERSTRAKTIVGDSTRMGALFTVGAVYANSVLKLSIDDSKWFGFASANIVFDVVYNHSKNTDNVHDSVEALAIVNIEQIKNSILKNKVLIANFAMDLISKRNEEYSRPSLANMILAAARGK